METFGTITMSSAYFFLKYVTIFGIIVASISLLLIVISTKKMRSSSRYEITAFLGSLIFAVGLLSSNTALSSSEKLCTADNIKAAIADNYSDVKFLGKEIKTEGYFLSKNQTYGYKVSKTSANLASPTGHSAVTAKLLYPMRAHISSDKCGVNGHIIRISVLYSSTEICSLPPR